MGHAPLRRSTSRLLRRVTPAVALATLALVGSALAADLERPRLVRVPLDSGHTVTMLLEAGLDVVGLEAGAARVLEWPHDAGTLARLGMAGQVLDPDPGARLALRARADLARRPMPPPRRVRGATGRDGAVGVQDLPPFGSGTMGGYWTIEEIKTKLDDLVASDAGDVVAGKIDTIGTSRQGRPIWGLELGKPVPEPDDRPAVLINALTHAREPIGMQALFYFVDHLLAGYGSDPFATYLLEQRRIYVVPLVNPDGYWINQDSYAHSSGPYFGLWRKNARDNNNNGRFDSSKDGVDLNRNFGYRWGKDNVGSSNSQSSEQYRGPSAFSEPETQAQRNLVTALQPRTGLSLHCFSDLLYFPWAHTESLAVDVAAFREWSDELTRDNAYQSGSGALGLFVANGDFGDWCYGDTLLKPKAFVWTPEIGNDDDDFYPPPSRFVAIGEENLRACYVTAALAGPYLQEAGVEILEGAMNAGHASSLLVRARNLGALATGEGVTGTLAALDPGAIVLAPVAGYPALGPRSNAVALDAFRVAVDDTVTPGRLMRFQIDFTAPDGLFSRDTLMVPAGTPAVVAFDNASSGLAKWSPGSWGIIANDPDHPSRYFADSPAGNYGALVDNAITLTQPLNLSAGVHAYAVYEAEWELEKNYDGASIQASLDGVNWQRIPATGTTHGYVVYPNEPNYSGTRWSWRPERADLSAFTGAAGAAVRLRFYMKSNDHLQFDGIGFDSLRVEIYDPALQPPPLTAVADAADPVVELAAPAPNPARGTARFAVTVARDGPARLEIFDLLGRRVRTLLDGPLAAGRHARVWDLRGEGGRAAPQGIYLARFSTEAGTRTRRFVVVN